MNQSASVNKTVKVLSVLAAVIMMLVPFQATVTVWVSSWAGHYTLIRLWKEFLLVPVVAGAIYLAFFKQRRIGRALARSWIFRLILAYSLLLVVCGLAAKINHGVTTKSLWYGLLVDLRFLVFFLAVAVLAASSGWLAQRWQKILFIPAILVAAFAVLQYIILPYDFLKHFGYGDSTISPYETINHNLDHLRVASTLRGANPLGAYLILPICALGVWLLREKRERADKLIFGGGLLLALVFSFSRSAWIGVVLGLLTVAWFSLKGVRARRMIIWALAGMIVLGAIAAIGLRHNTTFEDTFLHTNHKSTITESSNEGHSAAFKIATKDIYHQPLGSGTGTAGPQSVYNGQPAQIAENYYLQIGQEAGLLGMALFIAIIIMVGRMLYRQRADPLALALFATLIGLSFVNMLSHAWEDDTLAYVYWGLAGIAYAPIIGFKERNASKKHTKT
ncbi:O-antigen ligase family protein [Candidatus Saccharibacteria bacterium]|nr:O-antigen ligase family protein [Candidatus Saccharibacteria bacterium]